MNKDKLIFADGTEIELEAGASLGALQVLSNNYEGMVDTWVKFRPVNLSALQIKNGDGVVIGDYADLVLVSETSLIADEGTILTTYNVREKTTEEKRLDMLELKNN